MSTENYFKKRELKDKILKNVEDYKLYSEIEKSKIALTNGQVKEIVSMLEQIPTMYRGSGAYKAVEDRFVRNGRTIRKVLDLLKQ